MIKPSKSDLHTACDYQRRAQHYAELVRAIPHMGSFDMRSDAAIRRRVAEYQDMAALNAKIARGIMGIVE